MTQVATVEKILRDGYVQISVPRKSACGHDCEECAGCGMTGICRRCCILLIQTFRITGFFVSKIYFVWFSLIIIHNLSS